MKRRVSRAVRVGGVVIGGGAPIVVQSMTNTDTADVPATVAQVAELARAGSELVRITVNSAEAATHSSAKPYPSNLDRSLFPTRLLSLIITPNSVAFGPSLPYKIVIFLRDR